MKTVSGSVKIEASPERVWQLLTDFASYPSWNPFIRSVSGVLAHGERLEIEIRSPSGAVMKFRPSVLSVEAQREIVWRGKMFVRGLFDSDHHFRLTSVGGTTLFEQSETFTGILVRLIDRAKYQDVEHGFREMNDALKCAAEV